MAKIAKLINTNVCDNTIAPNDSLWKNVESTCETIPVFGAYDTTPNGSK